VSLAVIVVVLAAAVGFSLLHAPPRRQPKVGTAPATRLEGGQ
jgi:hypothetical protein